MVSKSVGGLEISPKKLIRQRWAEHHSEIGSAERDIDPGQTSVSIDPVNDAAHRTRAPQARSGMIIAMDEYGMRVRRSTAREFDCPFSAAEHRTHAG
jgi:hypothetical protein